ncbi:hypothetical protein OIE67_51035 [Nonomuraea fuscirosea]|uniref:hypothetical protein n=1 Tax=Nonomuraea fuscirosea TaxID=1291556 RepID=UPI002DD9CE02|nr:hypothetical protein [Nonomuraea fuscirosea]WSA52280.1 hypothetical protein OIE67_51035 [Nonomuraea fuscirosea]
MPHLGKITISSPDPGTIDTDRLMDAVGAAIQAGWESPRVLSEDEGDDEHQGGGSVEDYRVLGYPGGAIVYVLLVGGELEQVALAVTALGRHLTTWSPDLLAYSVDEVGVSRYDEPYDADNWLPLLDHDEQPQPHWSPEELLDQNLMALNARYILAGAVRSLWEPGRRVGSPAVDPYDVAAGAAEHPWGGAFVRALGTLLIRAARLDAQAGAQSKLTAQGAGDPALTADLLQRARATAQQSETEGWTDDKMRGHVLVTRFTEDHGLDWNQVRDGESTEQTDTRSADQLWQLLWAGLKTLATLAAPLAHVSSAWQLLDDLGDDEVVALIAERENERIDAVTEHDRQEVDAAAAAHAALWLAINRPELLATGQCRWLISVVASDVDTFHQLVYSAMVMAGTGPVRAAVDDVEMPATMHAAMTEFVEAQALTDPDGISPRPGDEEVGDAYDDMHHALEAALTDNGDLSRRVRGLLTVVGRAAELTATDVNTHLGQERHICAPRELTRELLERAAEHAAVIISDEEPDDDGSVRLNALSMLAQIAPDAAGAMAADFPDLSSDDPRDEPAARTRARQWVADAMRVVREHQESDQLVPGMASPDAELVLGAVAAEQELPQWPIQRVVAASAEAAATLLHTASLTTLAADVFTRT